MPARSIIIVALTVLAVIGFVIVSPATESDTATTDAPRAEATDARVELVANELHELGSLWNSTSGLYGYPFWEKALQRWRSGSLTPSMMREYVTGYRDSLNLTCETVDDASIGSDIARSVRTLLVDACEDRIDALKAQKQQLDIIVELASAQASSLTADERRELEEKRDEHAEKYVEMIQRSWRATREAMTIAQNELRASGSDLLDEDSFI